MTNFSLLNFFNSVHQCACFSLILLWEGIKPFHTLAFFITNAEQPYDFVSMTLQQKYSSQLITTKFPLKGFHYIAHLHCSLWKKYQITCHFFENFFKKKSHFDQNLLQKILPVLSSYNSFFFLSISIPDTFMLLVNDHENFQFIGYQFVSHGQNINLSFNSTK